MRKPWKASGSAGTRDATGLPAVGIKLIAGLSLAEARIAAKGLRNVGNDRDAGRVEATAIEGASALELYGPPATEA